MEETVTLKRTTYDELMADSKKLNSGKIYFTDYNGFNFYVYGDSGESIKVLEKTNQDLNFKVAELEIQLSNCGNIKKWYQFWK